MPQPPSTYAVDEPLNGLVTAELLLFAATRLWVAALRAGDEAPPDWRGAFRAAAVARGGAEGLDGLLGILAIASRVRLDVRCARCPRLGADEGRLLEAVALCQAGNADGSAFVLGAWLAPAACRAVLPHLGSLADALAWRGLVVPRRGSDATGTAAARAFAGADRGLALVQ